MKQWLLGLDVLVVVIFVAIGRDSHELDQSAADLVEVAVPFLIGVGVGWGVMRAWRRPVAMVTGAGVLAATVIVGMALRRLVFDDGIAATFILVATAFLGLGILGWRVVASRYRHTPGAVTAGKD
jgi:hypothetical protein